MPYLEPINEVHVNQPGLVDVAADGDATALGFQQHAWQSRLLRVPQGSVPVPADESRLNTEMTLPRKGRPTEDTVQ
ncbi:DUF6207 family protein [Streptomyces sp. TRM68367]|uniref:DUF6207 family protein n=1 Tax=Streptomyces sp. TRM68367 TaxID=2758415 RepID=UPI00293514BD|nr:DUF6207 family protein [Streptomyces sp. TRM68367]